MSPKQFKIYQTVSTEFFQSLNISEVMRNLKGELLSQNTKLLKDDSSNLYGLELVPANIIKGHNTCENAGLCKLNCIYFTGVNNLLQNKSFKLSTLAKKRIRRYWLYVNHNDLFMTLLSAEIKYKTAISRAQNKQAKFRLNVVSDLDFSQVIKENPTAVFYDYTKRNIINTLANYSLTYSFSEKMSVQQAQLLTSKGNNVAVVFADATSAKTLPKTWHGMAVVSGDDSDDRTLDIKGVIIGLYQKNAVKGKSKKSAFMQ